MLPILGPDFGILFALSVTMIIAMAAFSRPEFQMLTHPSTTEVHEGLQNWANQRPDAMKVEVVGRTANNLPMLLCRITDYNVDDDDKQIALITTCHSGSELNAATGALRFIRWLISDDPRAERIRRDGIVAVMPVGNPEGFDHDRMGNCEGTNPYTNWSFEGATQREKNPEGVAIQKVIDGYQPDIHCDIHGTWYSQQLMWESSGISWASGLARPYIHDIPRLMDKEAENDGFLITRGEEDAGQVRATAPVDDAAEHYYLQHAGVNDCVYSYHKYHTIAFTIEAGFEESIVARLRGMLEAGQRTWRYESDAGYPVNQIACWTSMAVAACGTTAAQRRRSRVELWQKLPQLQYGCAHPEPRGTTMAVCSTTPKGAAWLESKKIAAIIHRLEEVEGYDTQALRRFNERTPAPNLAMRGTGAEGEPIQHGLAMRTLVPYRHCEITHIALNGHPLDQSATDGYQITRNPGTVVQVNIPPAKVADLNIVTCAYDEDSGRRAGFFPDDWELQ